ncbi:MerR family transcriptional regulator [Allokutzneria oryzae]|uniref:MerR family transcriptional regulator n=1 Tax=Allokutzneria oryzae TaxID=1378989 RepID=A0ABV5ZP43_9PSEU
MKDELLSIGEVARRFEIRASALRYYEELGILTPTSRDGGRRWYGAAELRRLALIQIWSTSGGMSLGDIARILAGPSPDRAHWKAVVRARIEELDELVQRSQEARSYLAWMLACTRDNPGLECSKVCADAQTFVDERLR